MLSFEENYIPDETERLMFLLETYVPFLKNTGEQKTKPAQRDVELLRGIGLSPDIIIARSEDRLTVKSKKKIALICDQLFNAFFNIYLIYTVIYFNNLTTEYFVYNIICDQFGK